MSFDQNDILKVCALGQTGRNSRSLMLFAGCHTGLYVSRGSALVASRSLFKFKAYLIILIACQEWWRGPVIGWTPEAGATSLDPDETRCVFLVFSPRSFNSFPFIPILTSSSSSSKFWICMTFFWFGMVLCMCPACSILKFGHLVGKAYTLEAVWFVGTCVETACFLGSIETGLHESQKDCRPICKLRDLRVKLDKVTATDSTVNGQIFRCLPGPSDPSATAAQALASYAMTIAIDKPNYCRVATAFVATASCQHFLSSFLNIFNNSRKNLVLHVLVLICVGCIQ